MNTAGRPWWQQVTALVSVSAGGAISGFSFVPHAAADITSPTSLPIQLLALEQEAHRPAASDATLRSAIVNVTNYYLRMARSKTPAEMEAIIWQHVSSDGVDHGASCAAFASLTLELAAQLVGQHSWVTGGTSYPWPLHKWADVRVDPNPDSPGITSVLQDAEAQHRWHPLDSGYRPLPGDWVMFDGHVEVVTNYQHGVLHTVGGDSLPDYSVNAHTYRDPLAAQGVLGFINNGALTPAGGGPPAAGNPADAAPQAGPAATGTGGPGTIATGTAGAAAIPGVVTPAAAGHAAVGHVASDHGTAGHAPAGLAAAGHATAGQAPAGEAAAPAIPGVFAPATSPSASPPPRPAGASGGAGTAGPVLAAVPGAQFTGAVTAPSAGAGAAAVPGLLAPAEGQADRPPDLAAGPQHAAVPAGHAAGRYQRHEPTLPAVPVHDTAAQQAFIRSVAPGAITAQERYGVPAAVTIAQAIDESGWGLSSLAARDHNLFGIKGIGPAGSDPLPTQEFANGQWVTVISPFRVYRNASQSIEDHGRLLATSGYYQRAMAVRHDPDAFAAALTGVYATDPGYGAKIIAIMQRYDLYRYDRAAAPGPAPSSHAAPSPAPPSPAPPSPAAPSPAPSSPAPSSPAPANSAGPTVAPSAGTTPRAPAAAPSPARPPASAGAAAPGDAAIPGVPAAMPAPPLGTSATSAGATGNARTAAAARPAAAGAAAKPASAGPAAKPASAEPAAATLARDAAPGRSSAGRTAGTPSIETVAAVRMPAAAGLRADRAAPPRVRAAGIRPVRYRPQLPPSVRTAFTAMARVPLLREEPLYREIASLTGVRWELLAACDWMQCEAQPRYSPVRGERLGTRNPDGTIYRTKAEALQQCAADLVNLSRTVYGIDVVSGRDLSIGELAGAFAAFRWGGLLKLHHTSAMEFPYSVAGLTAQRLKMRWPNIDDPNAPDRPGTRFRMPFGALPVLLCLNYPATA